MLMIESRNLCCGAMYREREKKQVKAHKNRLWLKLWWRDNKYWLPAFIAALLLLIGAVASVR